MCNIAGYVGSRRAAPIIMEMLRREEGFAGGYYSGLATMCEGKIFSEKLTGDVTRLVGTTRAIECPGNIGIAHSRSRSGGGDEWAHPFIGLRDGEARIAYVANGSLGCFAERLGEFSDLSLHLAEEGYTFPSRTFGVETKRYPTLADGSAVHMSDTMCQLILRNLVSGMESVAAMEAAFCEMPSEIVGLLLNLKEPDSIAFSRINMPMFLAFAEHGAYLASTPLAFPDDAGEPILLPAGSSGRVFANRFEATKYKNRPASIAPIDAALIAKAYAKVREVLSTTEKTFSELCREVAPLFPKADCKPTAVLTYQILYALKRENVLVLTEKRVPGAREDLDAPKLYMQINDMLYNILKGKKLSVFGASMCTYDGYSNNTEHNPTIGANKQYYGSPESENVKCRDLTVGETFWGRLIDKYEMTLCVNNSWSGSKILDDNPAAAGWNTRPTELHRADGTEPDLIVSFMGNNDFTKERPAGEITAELFTCAEAEGFVPSTFAEGYAVMLRKITKRYPNAKVFLFNMAWRTEEKSELLIKYNEIIEQCAAHYGAHVIRLTESRMSRTNYAKYTCDGKLHPNAEGMKIWAELIEDALKECYQ